MITFDEVAEMLDDAALTLPPEIYGSLNGGVNLLPDEKMHLESVGGDLYILGEYRVAGYLGRFINIYYGSLMRVYGGLPRGTLMEKLTGVLKHELTHHLESMAGEVDLEIQDALDMESYKRDK